LWLALATNIGTALVVYRVLSAPNQFADFGGGFRAWGFSSNISLNPADIKIINQAKVVIISLLLTIDVTISNKAPIPMRKSTEGILASRSMPKPPTVATAANAAILPRSNTAAWGFCLESSLIQCSGSMVISPIGERRSWWQG
jgi:hypothetical protein